MTVRYARLYVCKCRVTSTRSTWIYYDVGNTPIYNFFLLSFSSDVQTPVVISAYRDREQRKPNATRCRKQLIFQRVTAIILLHRCTRRYNILFWSQPIATTSKKKKIITIKIYRDSVLVSSRMQTNAKHNLQRYFDLANRRKQLLLHYGLITHVGTIDNA